MMTSGCAGVVFPLCDPPEAVLSEVHSDQPVAILLHGWASDARAMRPVAERLGSRCRCLLPELPGHGEAPRDPLEGNLSGMADRLGTLLRGLKGQCPCVLVGWSLGGALALRTVAEAPGVCAGVVAAGAPARMTACEGYRGGVAPATIKAMIRSFREQPEAVLKDFVRNCFADSERTALESSAAVETLFRSVSTGDVAAKSALLESLAKEDIRHLLAVVYAPVRLLHGTADAIVPVESSRHIVRMCGRATAAEIEGAGHALPLLYPDRMAREVLQLMEAL